MATEVNSVSQRMSASSEWVYLLSSSDESILVVANINTRSVKRVYASDSEEKTGDREKRDRHAFGHFLYSASDDAGVISLTE